MLSKKEENIKKKILTETNQEKIIKIYEKENISMNILNDKDIQGHLAKYITIKEPEDSGHIYIRKKATKDYLKYANKIIKNQALTNK